MQSGDAGKKDVQLTAHFIPPRDVAQVAWFLATCADSHPREPTAALELAERAVKDADSDALSWAALGLRYRAERWEEALAALEKAAELPGTPPAAQVIRAMAHWRLGDHAKRDNSTIKPHQPFPKTAILFWRRPPC